MNALRMLERNAIHILALALDENIPQTAATRMDSLAITRALSADRLDGLLATIRQAVVELEREFPTSTDTGELPRASSDYVRAAVGWTQTLRDNAVQLAALAELFAGISGGASR
jgi:hypothetical protein